MLIPRYRDIPLVLVVYGGYKLIRRTKSVSLGEIPVAQALTEAENDPENVTTVKEKWWERWNFLW